MESTNDDDQVKISKELSSEIQKLKLKKSKKNFFDNVNGMHINHLIFLNLQRGWLTF